MTRNSRSPGIYPAVCPSVLGRGESGPTRWRLRFWFTCDNNAAPTWSRVGVDDKPRDRRTWVHRSSESRNVSLPPFITRGNEGPRGSVLFMGDAVIIRLCAELMNARVHTLMQLQIMHIPGICICAFSLSSLPPASLSLHLFLYLSPSLSTSNSRWIMAAPNVTISRASLIKTSPCL